MTDLFTAAPPPPARLTLAQQALLNLTAMWALDVMADNRAAHAGKIAAILPAARRDVPEVFDPVLEAADHIADCTARALPRDHRDWWDASMHTTSALIHLFGIRAIAAWRAHEDSFVIDPAHSPIPETGMSEHAQP
jgi:hypothetical protein